MVRSRRGGPGAGNELERPDDSAISVVWHNISGLVVSYPGAEWHREPQPGWRNGIRGRLKPVCSQGHRGSTPLLGTVLDATLRVARVTLQPADFVVTRGRKSASTPSSSVRRRVIRRPVSASSCSARRRMPRTKAGRFANLPDSGPPASRCGWPAAAHRARASR
jgi:hypothetical protein